MDESGFERQSPVDGVTGRARNQKTGRRWMRWSQLATAMCLAVSAAALQASVIDINGNTIDVPGDLTATVTHTADGMTITIPDVAISLDCGDGTTQSCVITLGGGSGSGASGSEGSGSEGSGSEGSGSEGSGSEGSGSNGSGSSGITADQLCETPRPTQEGSQGQIIWDRECANKDDSGNGAGDPPTNGGGQDPGGADKETCSPYDLECQNLLAGEEEEEEVERVPFPNGKDRQLSDLSDQFDVGSAGADGKSGLTVIQEIPEGSVVVYKFSVSDETDEPYLGVVTFAEGPVQTTLADFHFWLSKEQDGDPISERCSYFGHVEKGLRVSIKNDDVCRVEPSGVYYLNMTYCSTEPEDIPCRSETALQGVGPARVYIEAKY